MFESTGNVYYRAIGIDTVATIVNDVITSGALPVSVAMHASVSRRTYRRIKPRRLSMLPRHRDTTRGSPGTFEETESETR